MVHCLLFWDNIIGLTHIVGPLVCLLPAYFLASLFWYNGFTRWYAQYFQRSLDMLWPASRFTVITTVVLPFMCAVWIRLCVCNLLFLCSNRCSGEVKSTKLILPCGVFWTFNWFCVGWNFVAMSTVFPSPTMSSIKWTINNERELLHLLTIARCRIRIQTLLEGVACLSQPWPSLSPFIS